MMAQTFKDLGMMGSDNVNEDYKKDSQVKELVMMAEISPKQDDSESFQTY